MSFELIVRAIHSRQTGLQCARGCYRSKFERSCEFRCSCRHQVLMRDNHNIAWWGRGRETDQRQVTVSPRCRRSRPFHVCTRSRWSGPSYLTSRQVWTPEQQYRSGNWFEKSSFLSFLKPIKTPPHDDATAYYLYVYFPERPTLAIMDF